MLSDHCHLGVITAGKPLGTEQPELEQGGGPLGQVSPQWLKMEPSWGLEQLLWASRHGPTALIFTSVTPQGP